MLSLDASLCPRNLDSDFEEASDECAASDDEEMVDTCGARAVLDDESKDDSPLDSQTAEVHFDASLLSSLGGLEKVAAGAVPDTFLKEMGMSRWSDLATHTPYDYLQEPCHQMPCKKTTRDCILKTQDQHQGLYALRHLHQELFSTFYSLSCGRMLQITNPCGEVTQSSRSSRAYVIREDVLKVAPIEPNELCAFLGLLIARSIVPNKEKLAHHWKMREEDAIPRGCFGRFMARDRFMHISRNLHFSSNENPRAAKDRAWKLRPVQDRFAAGYTLPAIMAFDECNLPSRSTFNRMRVYIAQAPQMGHEAVHVVLLTDGLMHWV
ncbi:LOW QUALITY PROTEIN: hypothetical protein PHMEG_00021763 [Phytophthora megakarya]|uniref:PiggyBac transposable element-derived protein domain-containing protein n=1 Tax=Phytophthora megakarya TaxID=4795 RepID=A0A225VMC5_9STRA|nr:LOW QUALITY PROTEIN: hypothetical protein PHMEG_00021763 [Phytophthora megakarya]